MTPSQQYPGPYTAEYCRDNRITVRCDTPEQFTKICEATGPNGSPDRYPLFIRFHGSDAPSWHNSTYLAGIMLDTYKANHEITFDKFDFEEVDLTKDFVIKSPISRECVEWLYEKGMNRGWCGESDRGGYGRINNRFSFYSDRDIEGNHAPIITESQWKQAVEKLKKPLPTMDKKIISYELIKLYPGCNFKIGETINGLSLAKELKLADFPEFWKPHYAPTSQTITVVPGLEVRVEDKEAIEEMITTWLVNGGFETEHIRMRGTIFEGINIDSLRDRIEIVDGEARLKPAKEQNEAVEFAEYLRQNYQLTPPSTAIKVKWILKHNRDKAILESGEYFTTEEAYKQFKNRK